MIAMLLVSTSVTSAFSELAAKVAPALAELVSAALVLLLGAATRWVVARTRNEKVRGAMLRLDDAAAVAVREVEQAVVKALKAGAADGKLSAADAAAVKSQAIETLKTHLGPKGVAELKTVVGIQDVEAVIRARIEAAVLDLQKR